MLSPLNDLNIETRLKWSISSIDTNTEMRLPVKAT